MLHQLSIFLAKNAFMSERGEIYTLLEANFAETGSRRVSTIRELFSAWASRESSRNNDIHLAHRAIVKRLDNGMAFAVAIAPFIPQEEALILEAAEASGHLTLGLRSVNAQRNASAEINGLVLAAIAEPAMSLAAICLTGWFCGNSLWPELLKVVTEKYWPAWTLPLIHFEIALAQHWQVMGSIFVFIFLYLWSIPRWTGRVRSVFDQVPPYLPRPAVSGFFGRVGRFAGCGDGAGRSLGTDATVCLTLAQLAHHEHAPKTGGGRRQPFNRHEHRPVFLQNFGPDRRRRAQQKL